MTQSTHLAWLGVLTDGGFVRRGQLRGIVVHIQDADAHCRVGRHGVIIYERRWGRKHLKYICLEVEFVTQQAARGERQDALLNGRGTVV